MPQLLESLFAAGHKPFDLQIERLIVLLRITLTSFCLITFVTAQGQQLQDTSTVTLILAAYTIFGLNVVLLPTVGRVRTGWQLPVHLVDIGVISVLMYYLEEISSTFFILYVFVLLSATVRWNWRGALLTTALLLALQAILFVSIGGVSQFLIQYTFLLVIGGMFAFFGASRERSGERLMELAAWPSPGAHTFTDTDGGDQWLNVSLTHIATVLQVPRVLVLWEIEQEPYLFTALFVDGKFLQDRKSADAFGDLVAPELGTTTFSSENVKSDAFMTLEQTKLYVHPIIDAVLQTHFEISSVCTAPFSGKICKGRVFILDRSDWREDDLTLTEVVASRIGIELEHYALSIRLQETAANQERIRLARDLHDGILQSLTAAGLQLKTIASRSEGQFQQTIENVRKLILAEQQRIRTFVDTGQRLIPEQPFALAIEMQREMEAIQRQWGCEIQLSITPKEAKIPAVLGRQLYLILAEASANAVQHGQASHIDVVIERTPHRVRLRITDNGHGLKGITETYHQAELATRGIGPQSLCKRIAELNGLLTLSSSPGGVELRIDLPCNSEAAYQPDDQANAFSQHRRRG
jgi:signal transduction histidine kinase